MKALPTASSKTEGKATSRGHALGLTTPRGRSTAKPLTTGLLEARRAYLAEVPSAYRGAVEKAFAGKSKAAALKAKCLDCCGFIRDEVRYCPTNLCPLWPYRPYQDAGDAGTNDNKEEAE